MNKKRKRIARRFFSVLLAAAMVLSAVPVDGLSLSVYAKDVNSGLCEHHTEHTAECGYEEAQLGEDCTHEQHTESCYKMAEKCVHEHTPDCYPEEQTDGEPLNCSHVCQSGGDGTEDGCIIKELDCPHENGVHDAVCGYTEGTEGSPCTYVCDTCKGQDDGQDSGQNTENPGLEECVCESLCTDGLVNTECPVCSTEDADLSGCNGKTEQIEECICESLCTDVWSIQTVRCAVRKKQT